MEPTKREQRQHKRELKRAGTQRRRRRWKRDLRENPEEAPYSREDFGRYSTAELNGMDRDNTRRRDQTPGESPRAESPDSEVHTELAEWGGEQPDRGSSRNQGKTRMARG